MKNKNLPLPFSQQQKPACSRAWPLPAASGCPSLWSIRAGSGFFPRGQRNLDAAGKDLQKAEKNSRQPEMWLTKARPGAQHGRATVGDSAAEQAQPEA